MEKVSGEITNLFIRVRKNVGDSGFPQRDLQSFVDSFDFFTSFTQTDLFHNGNQVAGLQVFEKCVEILGYLNKLSEKSSFSSKNSSKVAKFAIFVKKLSFLRQLIEPAFKIENSDLSCLPESDPRLQALTQITKKIHPENKEKLQKETEAFHAVYDVLKAMYFKMIQHKKSGGHDFYTGCLIFKFLFISKKKRKIYARLFENFSSSALLKSTWDLNDTRLFTKIIKSRLEPVKVNKVIFVPRLAPHVLSEFQNEPKQESNLHYVEALSQEPILAGSAFTLVSDPEKFRVPIRILSSFAIPKLDPSLKSDNHKFDKIVIHVHGGGFMGMSTFAHQPYTNLWTNRLGVPIFSIEYRLAPAHKYPAAFDDVWQAYTWIVKYSHKFLGIIPKKIVLIGDSAGGTLITALTVKAILSGFRVPDAIVPVYPGYNMQINHYSKGCLVALTDKVLVQDYFFTIRDNYVPSNESVENYFISPLFTPLNLLEKFPVTRIMTCTEDPLTFDTNRFCEKLLQAKVNLEIIEFVDFSHGALNLGNDANIPSYKTFVDEACEVLKKLLECNN